MTYTKPEVLAQEAAPCAYVASCYRPQSNDCCECTHGGDRNHRAAAPAAALFPFRKYEF